ncbi:ABC transporter substrate-binding protein [Ochrobactrum teleogrylli]
MRQLAMVAVTAFGIIVSPIGASAETIKIGIIGMMTGPGATWGVAGSEGVRLAADDVNAAGGVDINGTKMQVEVVVYDDQYKAAEAIAAYNRLVNEDGVKYMMTMSSASMMALKDTVESDNVLVLTSSYTSKAIDKDTRHILRLYATPRDYVPGIIKWMKDNVPGNRVTLLYPNDETGWDFASFSSEAFKNQNYEVKGQELFERAQKDFQPILTRIIATSPDIIDLGPTSPATAGLIVRQARELGYKGTFSALGGSGPREVVAAAGRVAAEGMVNMLYADPKNPAFQALVDRFRAKIGQAPNELIVPYYDATKVLLRAISLSGEPDNPEKVREHFADALPMKSLLGEDMTFGGKSTIGIDAQIMGVNYVGNIQAGEPVAVGLAR